MVQITYQYPVWGTEDWEKRYNKRSNVERGFSTLKNPDVIGMTPGLYRIRGLVKMSLLVACMFAAHNLHLWMLDEERLAKVRPRIYALRSASDSWQRRGGWPSRESRAGDGSIREPRRATAHF